jgi:hypothetical protein
VFESHCVICHDYDDRDDYDDVDRGVIANVEKFGWSVTGVPADSQGPGWAYTIGRLHSRSEPELAMFGLGLPVMQSCLNILGERDTLTDGQSLDDVVNGYPVRLRAVEPSWFRAFFGQAMWFYRRPPVPVLQVVWPARDGRFPWEDGSLAQPHLWLPPAGHPRGVWTQDV